MLNIVEHFRSLHQDAVLWKSEYLWRDSRNPDLQVQATEKIVGMLGCITNVMKRDTYVTRIAEGITEKAKQIEEELKRLDSHIKNLTKDYDKLCNKKNPSEEESKEATQLRDQIAKLNTRKTTLGMELLPKLSASELKSYLKEDLERKELAAKKKAEASLKDKTELLNEDIGVPLDFDGNTADVVRFGIYAYKGKYYSKSGKGTYDEVSNFTMRILFHVNTGGDAAYRLIVVKNVYNIEKTVNINTDDFVSVSSFKKILARQGDFVFKGSDSDLARLSEYLQQHEKPTQFVDILGYNTRGQFYAWANGVIDTKDAEGGVKFHEADEYGIVSLRDRNYFVPALSKMYIDKEHLYQNEKRFFYAKDSATRFKDWSALHFKVHSIRGAIGQCWLLSALYRDFIFNQNNIRATPMLFLYGQRASGKGVFSNSLLSPFGTPQPPIGLGSVSTPKGYQRKFAQYKNAVVWLDEYKNNINRIFVESLKQIYDGIGYTRAKMTNDFQTDDMPVNSACLLSGQEMPTIEPALFSRVILLQFEPGKDRTEEAKANFRQLQNLETHGISNITGEILQHREVFTKRFPGAFSRKLKEFYERLNNKAVDDRFIMNIAILSASFECLQDKIQFPFSQDDVDVILIENLKSQFAIMEGNDDLGKWWQIVENLASQRLISSGIHFRLSDTTPGSIYIKVQDVYPLYLKEMRQRGDNNVLSKPTLEHYLENDKDTFLSSKKARFAGHSFWCKEFNYKVLQDRYELELLGYGKVENSDISPAPDNSNGSLPF